MLKQKLMNITAEDLANYKRAQELKVFEYQGRRYEQNRYSLSLIHI